MSKLMRGKKAPNSAHPGTLRPRDEASKPFRIAPISMTPMISTAAPH